MFCNVLLLCIGMDLFAIELYHGGRCKSKPVLHYRGGKSHMFKEVDPDGVSFFELKGMVKDIRYNSFSKFFLGTLVLVILWP